LLLAAQGSLLKARCECRRECCVANVVAPIAHPEHTQAWRNEIDRAMKKNQDQPADALRAVGSPGGSAAELRRRAEERLKGQRTEDRGQRTAEDTARLVHELQVHQIELEMQNEELRQARAQLCAHVAQYIDLFEFAPTGYLILDREGVIRQANLAVARLFGVARSRLLKRRFGLFVAEGDRRAFSDFLHRVFAGQARECCEVTLPQAGPHPLFVRVEGTRSADGQECLAVVLDLTERKRAEAALRESESRFRTIFDSVSGGMFLVDLATRKFETCNTMCSKMIGYTKEDFARLDISDLHPAEDLPFISEELGRFAQGKLGARNDIRFRRKDGTVFFADLSPALVTLAGRKFILVAFSDITERKRAEETLRASEERFRIAAETANDVVYEWNLKQSVQWLGKIDEMLGYEPAEFPRTLDGWAASVHPEDVERTMDAIHAHLEGRAPYIAEYRVRRKDGVYRWWVARGAAARMPDGKPVRWIGSITDITERKRAEEEREQMLRWQQGISLVQQSLLAPAPLEEKLRSITDSVVRLFDADFCRIWLIRPGDLCERGCVHAELKEGPHICRYRDRCLHLLASSGRYTHIGGQAHRRVPFGAYKIGRVASGEDHKFLTNDVTSDPLVHNHQWARELGLVSFAGYQLRIPGGGTLGVLALFAKHPILPAEDALLDGLSSALAQAIQQAQAEAALRASEAKYRGLFEITHDAIMTLESPSWRFTSGNPATMKMFGAKTKEQFISNVPWGLSPERQPDGRASAEKAKEMIETAMREGFHSFEWTHRRTGGEEFPADVFLTRMEQGGKMMLHATVRDITERKRAEKTLRDSQEVYSSLVENLPQSVFRKDREGRFLFCNQRFCAGLGHSLGEIVGKTDADFFPPHLAEAYRQDDLRVMESGQALDQAEEHVGADGRKVFVQVVKTPLRDASGGISGVQGIFWDVTEQRKLEAQARRTDRLESIGTLAGGVAHDLNNALAPILMATELLRLEFPDTAANYLELIQAGTKRGADMVKQLLTFAKGTEGERVLIQPRHLLKEMGKLIRGTFPKNLELRTSYAKDLRTVLGDATQLHQVLLNLCVNARDAMPSGGTLTVEAENVEIDATYAREVPEANPGHYVVWRVTDTGTGIPPEILDRIFEPFFTTKSPDKGTGLGLSTVIGIVRSHGGFVRVYSAPGQGSTFAVYLPACGAAAGTSLLTKAETTFRGNGETILVVDDEAAVREVLRKLLTALNFKVLTVTNGTEALIEVAEKRAELRMVITDLHMPQMDGLTFVRVLKGRLPRVGIIVISGRLDEREENEFKALGVSALLDKPFTQAKLVETLKTAFQN